MIVSSKNTLLIILLKMHDVLHPGHNSLAYLTHKTRLSLLELPCMALPNWSRTSRLLGWLCFTRPFLRLILRLGMYVILHVSCESFLSLLVGRYTHSSRFLEFISRVYVFDYGCYICFLRNFCSYDRHPDLCGDDAFHLVREGER